MLAWVMNLGFAAGGVVQVPTKKTLLTQLRRQRLLTVRQGQG